MSFNDILELHQWCTIPSVVRVKAACHFVTMCPSIEMFVT